MSKEGYERVHKRLPVFICNNGQCEIRDCDVIAICRLQVLNEEYKERRKWGEEEVVLWSTYHTYHTFA